MLNLDLIQKFPAQKNQMRNIFHCLILLHCCWFSHSLLKIKAGIMLDVEMRIFSVDFGLVQNREALNQFISNKKENIQTLRMDHIHCVYQFECALTMCCTWIVRLLIYSLHTLVHIWSQTSVQFWSDERKNNVVSLFDFFIIIIFCKLKLINVKRFKVFVFVN